MNDVVFPSRYKPAHDQLAQEKLSLTKREETPKRISRDDEICFLESLSPPRRPQVRGAETAHISNQHAKTSLLLTLCIFIKLVKKTHLFWVSMCLARKWYSKTLILIVLLETGPPFYVAIRTTRRSSRFAGHDFGHRKCIKVQVCFGNCVITSLRCFSYYTVTKANLNFLCVS